MQFASPAALTPRAAPAQPVASTSSRICRAGPVRGIPSRVVPSASAIRFAASSAFGSSEKLREACSCSGRAGCKCGCGCGFAAASPAAPAVLAALETAEVLPAVAAVAGGLAILAVGTKNETTSDIDDKKVVEEYFNNTGFDRWRRIYGETEDVNKVQKDIREGHQVTVDTVLAWLRADEDGTLKGRTLCDLGCGCGSLAIPAALEGAIVSASDISAAMTSEAQARWEATPKSDAAVNPKFTTSDLESVAGKYDTVCCLDVFIHYPQDKASEMIAHLASLSDRRLIVSFAPYTPGLALLKKVGSLFPGPSKATRAYLHAESEIRRILEENGFEVKRESFSSTRFYFSKILEAVRKQ